MAIEDTFIPVYYRVEINSTGLGGSAPADGFVDNLPAKEFNPLPSTRDNSITKERGNVRYEEIIRQLSENISPVNHTPREIDAPGRSGDSAPIAFDFTVVFDRPEYLRTEDEDNPGTFLTGAAAVRRWVARALSLTRYDNREIFNPQTNSSGVRDHPREIINVTTGAIAADVATAEANITVTEISNT